MTDAHYMTDTGFNIINHIENKIKYTDSTNFLSPKATILRWLLLYHVDSGIFATWAFKQYITVNKLMQFTLLQGCTVQYSMLHYNTTLKECS